jgi:hypothetical protein
MRKEFIKVKILLSSIAIIIFLFIPAFAMATPQSYYVTQNGAGARNGASLSDAWSISDFNNSANWSRSNDIGKIDPGDTVYFSGSFVTKLTPRGSGVSGNYITLDGYEAGDCDPLNSECLDSALLKDEKDALHIGSGLDYLKVIDFRLTGRFRIDNYKGTDASEYIEIKRCHGYDTNTGVLLISGPSRFHKCKYITVENCKWENFGRTIDTAQGLNFNHIQNFIFRYNYAGNDGNDVCTSANTIEVHDTQNALFEYNDISGAPNQAGLAVKEWEINEDLIVRFNKIHDNAQKGMAIGYIKGIYIYGNAIYNNGLTPDSVNHARTGIDIKDRAENVFIWSNLIYDHPRRGIWVWERKDGPPSSIFIVSNTIANNGYSTESPSVCDTGVCLDANAETVHVKYNIFYNNRKNYRTNQQISVLRPVPKLSIEHNQYYYSGDTATIYMLGKQKTLDEMRILGYEDDSPEGLVRDPVFNDINKGEYTASSLLPGSCMRGLVRQIIVGANTYSMYWEDGIDPNGTDYSVTPPVVRMQKRNDDIRCNGAYAKSDSSFVTPSRPQQLRIKK